MSRIPFALRVLRALREFPALHTMYRSLVGYHRPFSTFREAYDAISPYANEGHEHPDCAQRHLELNKAARSSDYAALFYVRPLLPDIRRVFDLGGNVGNLFYCYAKYLDVSSDVVWQVYDLPANLTRGRELAQQSTASQLRFTARWTDASGTDLLIASGSLHYFERSFSDMLRELRSLPKYILINRTPLTDGTPVATVQDAITYRVACMVRNRADLIRGLTEIGYEVLDAWTAAELSLEIPGYPEHSVRAYSGFFLRLAKARSYHR
ncbi:MAG: hypothetical protein NVSMB5_04370 [Candidatus Velthaea sp.]